MKEQIKELDALIRLMDEPNEDMYTSIRDKIMTYGSSAIPKLENAWLNSDSDQNARRIEDLIENIRFTDLYHELHNWSNFYTHDLLKAFILLTRFRYPDLDEELYIARVEKLKKNVWLEINPELTALEKVKVLNHVFFDIYGFRGQLPQQISINAYFLNDIFDNKKGSAIALGILYLYIAQGLDIPIFGIDLHHHFALVYMEDNVAVKDPGEYTAEEILFYIAVVNKGSVFTKNEIRRYLRQINLEEDPRYYLPNTNVQVVRKFINELINTYEVTGKQDKADLLLKMIHALD